MPQLNSSIQPPHQIEHATALNGLTAEAGNTVANGTDVNTVQLPVKDANGNPIPGFEVTFTVTEPDGSTRHG
ncbi:Ig-like domain-containing protein [Serratia fonticola]